MRASDVLAPFATRVVVAAVALSAPLVSSSSAQAAGIDDRLVLAAPNELGQTGLVRTTSAQIGDTGLAYVGLAGRGFSSSDFVVPGKDDAATFLEGNAVLGFSLFRVAEISVRSRAGIVLDSARAQPQASVGDTTLTVKGGYGFGLVAAAASVQLGLPTRSNKVGVDLGNAGVGGFAHVTVDLLPQGVPLRAHVLGGYTLQLGKLGDASASNPYFLDGPDGALIALAAQQWFHDHVSVGVGVEVPLPYVTPFLEVSYLSAIGVDNYAAFGDAALILTPGVRVGLGGLRVDLGADIGLSGTGGGAAVDIADTVPGQPITPLWSARVAVSHAFDFVGHGSTSSGSAGPVVGAVGGGTMGRVEGCVKDDAGIASDAAVTIAVNGQPGPRLLVDNQGCYALPVTSGDVVVTASGPGRDDVSSTVRVDNGSTARADLVLKGKASGGHIVGFVTNKDDETVDVTLTVADKSGSRDAGSSRAGAFDLEVKPGITYVTATAPGYLAQGVAFNVEAGARRATTFVMRKVPKKRSATMGKDKIETTARVPFVFKTARLQSTSGYLLDEVADLLLTNPTVRVSIEAHTDASEMADPSDAKALTEARAQSVKDALVTLGIAPERLETVGKGIKDPVGKAN
ncbi:MAG TPA: OmpA family protein, partial [Myxococcota bacterium]